MGTVHIFVDHPGAVQVQIDQNDSAAEVHDSGSESSWVETDWRPAVLEGLEEKLAGKNECVLDEAKADVNQPLADEQQLRHVPGKDFGRDTWRKHC